MSIRLFPFALAGILAGCGGAPTAPEGTPAESAFELSDLGEFDEPWAMSFLPDGALLVTEKSGHLRLRSSSGELNEVSGVPEVAYGGQGGLGDVIIHPEYASNQWIYLSYAEAGSGEDEDRYGAAVARARLHRDAEGARLEDVQVIWRQVPKVEGQGHYGHRLAFGPDGKLWISSGERQKFDPAQDLDSNLGKVLRLNADGSLPADNPYAASAAEHPVRAQIWSMGHRNPLGIAFDAQGQLWLHEMGPAGGDELNRIQRGANYGYPIVSNGDHYDGRDIPDHDTQPEYAAPAAWWTPVIAPAGMVIYDGSAFPQWRGQALIGGLASQALVRVGLAETGPEPVRELERYAMGVRIREVEQAPDGSIWVLEDGSEARLRRLAPRQPH